MSKATVDIPNMTKVIQTVPASSHSSPPQPSSQIHLPLEMSQSPCLQVLGHTTVTRLDFQVAPIGADDSLSSDWVSFHMSDMARK